MPAVTRVQIGKEHRASLSLQVASWTLSEPIISHAQGDETRGTSTYRARQVVTLRLYPFHQVHTVCGESKSPTSVAVAFSWIRGRLGVDL